MSRADRRKLLADQLAERGIPIDTVKAVLKCQSIETPSWGYGNSGTRFAVFRQPGAARDIHERLADAAFVHKLTGICPSVAIHIPWDKTSDYAALTQQATELGVRIGSVNPNVFQEPAYKLGSFGNPDPRVRGKAMEHMAECIEIMQKTGSRVLSLWFADGTNYPGQDSFRRRKRFFLACLKEVYSRLPEDAVMLLEYKPFEPAFYHTDIADWGMAFAFCRKLGPKAKVLVDLGHHLPGANIEHIVSFLIDEDALGGFHFNNRKYADDDLTTGSINPYEVFLIHHEIVSAEAYDLAFMVDQSHNLKPKLEAMITTAMFLQESLARALLVDTVQLGEAQATGDIVLAERCLQQAFTTDVSPLVEEIREEMGCPPDPLIAYRQSGYQQRIEAERQGQKGTSSGWA
ncbi:MAG: L-rhamnose isomerase [Planctomycetota bacterium]